jgi:hypothetical protein
MIVWFSRAAAVVALAVIGLLVPASPTPAERPVGAAAGATFGDAVDLGSMRGRALAQPVVGMAATPSGRGYWLVARDGGIFSFGDAAFRGSTGGRRLNQPIVGMAPSPSGQGYWFVAADGGVFSFGDAVFRGSTGGQRLNQPIVGMAASPSGRGYWLVARDGGIFAFGDARYAGSAARSGLQINSVAPTSTGAGYWLLASTGRVLPYGDAPDLPRSGGGVANPAVALAVGPEATGFWAAGRNGAVAAYGNAAGFGAAGAASPVVGMAATPSGRGYWLVTRDGDVLTKEASPPSASGSYAFLSKDDAGRPLRYNPCAPVRFALNPTGAPAGAVAEVREAFRRLGGATGIAFVDAGTTTEVHARIGGPARRSYQPERYGSGVWAPILISWVDDDKEPVLAGAVLGYGGSTSYWTSESAPAYITGEVVFDRDLSVTRPGFGPGLTRGNLVLHELAHVIGLDHVQDRAQVMHPSISGQSPDGYGPGDVAGLARLGRSAGCLQVAAPS